MGKLLAVGDLKALLARLLGMARMEEVLMKSGLQAAVNTPYLDGASFDQFRPAMWRTLREDYPTKIDPKSLKGEEVGDTVNPATYLHRQLKRWKLETGRNPEGDELMTTLFRTSIVEAMPTPVQQSVQSIVDPLQFAYQQNRGVDSDSASPGPIPSGHIKVLHQTGVCRLL
ncbi:hypothetical protein SKAU_G00095370 [Synaphobranchus kaupii]|uniref:Uncharacterized protein n=1 Tax=Synaphobranchus kaupii TaxID=118154 RepID=A0A9Q1FY30_SYNKA|nr:hypothetical protein SKAU_G00095370 [Synaphobranchus kaupii]